MVGMVAVACVHVLRYWVVTRSALKFMCLCLYCTRHGEATTIAYTILYTNMSVGLDPFVHPSFWIWEWMRDSSLRLSLSIHIYTQRYKRVLVVQIHRRRYSSTLTHKKGNTNNINHGDNVDDVMKYFVAMNFYAIRLLHQIHHTSLSLSLSTCLPPYLFLLSFPRLFIRSPCIVVWLLCGTYYLLQLIYR